MIKSQFEVFFKLVDEDTALQIFLHMVPRQYLKGTIIVEESKQSAGVWFIIKGSVKCTHSLHQSIDLIEYSAGSYFGDVCVMNDVSDRWFFAGDSDLQSLFIQQEDFLRIM